MIKIIWCICLLGIAGCLFAEGGDHFYRRGERWTDPKACRMPEPLLLPGPQHAGVWCEKKVPSGYRTLAYRVALPRYREGMFFSRDERPGDYTWPHNTNRLLPWTFRQLGELLSPSYPGIPSNGKVAPQGDALLLHLQDGQYLFLKAVAGPNSLSWLEVTPEGELLLYVSTLGQDELDPKVPLVLYACEKNPYTVVKEAYRQLTGNKYIADVRQREKKEFPEPFHYLGWCSWEQYHKNIDERQLLADLRRIEDSGLPVRYVLIDDGHVQSEKDRLTSFRPDPAKFPRGWQPILQTRRKDKIRWIGLWYALPGYWQGIAADNDFPEEIGHCLFPYRESLLPGKSRKNIEAYYRYYLRSLHAYGFDFLKIDVQSLQLPLYMGGTQVIPQARECNRVLEKETHRLGMGLINCMAHNTLNTDHTRYSAVTRVSIDYLKFDEDMARSHLFQSYVNTLLFGQTVWPDHDMFHSCDSICGGMMARSKALSGGPVYLSDAPGDFVPELIWPLVDADGRLYRPEAPAIPAPEALFTDPFRSGEAWKVVAPVGEQAMALICYNLNVNQGKAEARLSPDDYLYAEIRSGKKSGPARRIVIYDWQNQAAEELQGEKKVVLEGFTDRLFYFCPIVEGWGVIGLQEKYLSPATVKIKSCTPERLILEVSAKGTLNVWKEGELRKIKVEGPGRVTLNR